MGKNNPQKWQKFLQKWGKSPKMAKTPQNEDNCSKNGKIIHQKIANFPPKWEKNLQKWQKSPKISKFFPKTAKNSTKNSKKFNFWWEIPNLPSDQGNPKKFREKSPKFKKKWPKIPNFSPKMKQEPQNLPQIFFYFIFSECFL